jgi:DNA-binding GntR family transcriptional regulator
MKKTKLSEQVYEKLKAKIISLEFQPGEALQERILAEALEVSRTPVREALLQLAQEGWVDLNARRSILVKDVSMEDIDEIFEVRKIIEQFALREIFERKLNRKLAGELDLIVQEMTAAKDDSLAFSKEDLRYHEAFVSILENSRLERIWVNIAEEMVRLGMLSTRKDSAQMDVVLEKHLLLVDRLWNNEQEKASEMVRAIRNETYEALGRTLMALNHTA